MLWLNFIANANKALPADSSTYASSVKVVYSILTKSKTMKDQIVIYCQYLEDKQE